MALTDTAHAARVLTETATPDTAAPAAIGSDKINSNSAQPTDGQTASPSLPAEQDSDDTFVEIIGESDSDSDYVKSAKNSPMISANTPDLEGHISDLEEVYEVVEINIVELTQPTMRFSHND